MARLKRNFKWALMVVAMAGLGLLFAQCLEDRDASSKDSARTDAKSIVVPGSSDYSPAPARHEVVELRTLDSKTFDNGDGTMTALISTGPIHYLDPVTNNLEEIKTGIAARKQLPLASRLKASEKLALRPLDREAYDFANETNLLRSYFKARSKGTSLVRVELGESDYLIWQPVSIRWENGAGGEEKIDELEDVPGVANGNTVSYQGIFANVDEEFISLPGMLKDQIILAAAPAAPVFSGPEMSLVIEGALRISSGLKLAVKGQEPVDVFESASELEIQNSKGEPVAFIMAPKVHDKNLAPASAAVYRIRRQGEAISFSVKISADWILSQEIVYPVMVDPTVRANLPVDTVIASGCADYNYHLSPFTQVGEHDTDNGCQTDWVGAGWGMVRPGHDPVPACISAARISQADLYLYVDPATSVGAPPAVKPERIGSSWEGNSVTWQSRPGYVEDGNEKRVPDNSTPNWEKWGVINSVQKWHGGNAFYGFYLMPVHPQAGDNYVSFYAANHSAECSPKSPLPLGACSGYLEVQYANECAPNSTCCTGEGCFRPAGYSCNDSDACTSADHCQAGGVCKGSYKCTPNSKCCDASGCWDPFGSVCEDGNACTSGETCDANHRCKGGVPECAAGSTCCTKNGCWHNTGDACDDGDACTAGENCDASHLCVGGSNYCTPLSTCCDASGCFLPSGTVCNVTGVCQQGACLDCAYEIISPNGGQKWMVGARQKIKWVKYGTCSATVQLKYSIQGPSGPWKTIQAATDNDGGFTWKVPASPTSRARVQVVDSVNAAYSGMSAKNFTILSASAAPPLDEEGAEDSGYCSKYPDEEEGE